MKLDKKFYTINGKEISPMSSYIVRKAISGEWKMTFAQLENGDWVEIDESGYNAYYCNENLCYFRNLH